MTAAQAVSPFAIASNGVDPARVPQRTLASGAQIPAIGLGTFESDKYTGDDVADKGQSGKVAFVND